MVTSRHIRKQSEEDDVPLMGPATTAINNPLLEEEALLDEGEEAAAVAMEAAAAAEAAAEAEATLGNVLDDVGVDGMHHGDEVNDETWADVHATDGMAVVVDQALLATAAAAAASQVADVLTDNQPTNDTNVPNLPPPLPETHHHTTFSPSELLPGEEDGEQGLIVTRRSSRIPRKAYNDMSDEARAEYNAHRREMYHKQSDDCRKRRRNRERERYHSLLGDERKQRNARRAELERARYTKLSKDQLAERNHMRREKAKERKQRNGGKVTKAARANQNHALASVVLPPSLPGGDGNGGSMQDDLSEEIAEEVVDDVDAGTVHI